MYHYWFIFFQAICYLTPDDDDEYAGESRKNKDKQTRREERKKEKQKKKKNKKKNKDKNVDFYDDLYDEEEEEDEVTETPEEDDSVDLDNVDSEDCEVFKCDMVRYGYQIFQLYDKVQNLRSKIDDLRDDNWFI